MIRRCGAGTRARGRAGPGSTLRRGGRVRGGRRPHSDRGTRGLDQGSPMTRNARRNAASRAGAVRRGVLLAPILAGVLAAGAAGAGGAGLRLGPAATGSQHTFKGFYDGHKDTYIVT